MSNASSIRLKAFSVFIALSFLQLPAGARAGTITFDDLSDDVSVADTTGRITSSVCINEHCFVTFSAPLQTVSASGTPIALNVRESALGAISDVVFFNFSSGAGMIEFVSDVEGVVLDAVPGPFIVETGAVQDVAGVTWTLANGSTVIDTIAFVSDVPEPASAGLLGIGLLSLGLIRRRTSGLICDGHRGPRGVC